MNAYNALEPDRPDPTPLLLAGLLVVVLLIVLAP
jgi:hypothetical protein